jgi:hypothetical protein
MLDEPDVSPTYRYSAKNADIINRNQVSPVPIFSDTVNMSTLSSTPEAHSPYTPTNSDRSRPCLLYLHIRRLFNRHRWVKPYIKVLDIELTALKKLVHNLP